MKLNRKSFAGALSIILASAALTSSVQATAFTFTSPTAGGTFPVGVTQVGGIVLDIVGLNGNRLVAQTAASSLFEGFASTNPFDIGTQTGLGAGIISQLGGGFSEIAVRISLWDGDTAGGDFDQNENTFLLNGIDFGDWTSVQAQETDGSGTVAGTFSGGGFRNETLDTGFFYSNDSASLADLYTSIVNSGVVIYGLSDVDAGDNYYDFRRGVDGGLVDVETPPVVTPVPEGGAMGLTMLLTLGGLFAAKSRMQASKK